MGGISHGMGLGMPWSRRHRPFLLANNCWQNWTLDDPDGWTVTGEFPLAAEVSEVGAGQIYGGTGTGYCNIYVDNPVVDTIELSQDVLTIGIRYTYGIVVNNVRAGGIYIIEGINTIAHYTAAGNYHLTFIATGINFTISSNRGGAFDDITLGCIRLYAS